MLFAAAMIALMIVIITHTILLYVKPVNVILHGDVKEVQKVMDIVIIMQMNT